MSLSNKEIAQLRTDYSLKRFSEEDVLQNPFAQFKLWFDEAIEACANEPTAMTLATATPDGKPTARIVLLKSFDEKGFVFFTNYQSAKGKQLLANPHAALVFFWVELQRQVRISGTVKKIPEHESDAYSASRPIGSQIAAHVSSQSQKIENRHQLEAKFVELEAKYSGKPIPRPQNWGGFIVEPTEFEFWQGRSNRLHDRFLFEKSGQNWEINRLSP